MPHAGDWRQAGVVEAAEELNSVLGSPRGLVSVDTPQVRIAAIKRAEDSDAVVIRLYEAWGRPCRARVETAVPHGRVALCDLLERERAATSLDAIDFRPFQVVTLKLEQKP
jgi:alpha-mannosidase